MPATNQPPRLLRASIIAVTSLALGALAHHLAHGALPSLTAAPFVLAPIVAASTWFARRTRSTGAIAAFLAFTQLGLHWAFTPAAALTASGATHEHAHGGAHAMHAATATAHGSGSSLTMVLAHAIAVLAVGALLGRGERLLLRLWRWAFRAVLLTLDVPVLTGPATPVVGVRVLDSVHLRGCFATRGPPAQRLHSAVLA